MDMIKGAAELRRLFAERSPGAVVPELRPAVEGQRGSAIYRWFGMTPPDPGPTDDSTSAASDTRA